MMHRSWIPGIAIVASVFAGVTAMAESGRVGPQVLAFYVPGFGMPDGPGGAAAGGRHIGWRGVEIAAKSIDSTRHFPARGPYDSHDPAVIADHFEQAREAGITGFVVHWAGPETHEGRAFSLLLDAAAAADVAIAVSYERMPERATTDEVAREIADFVVRFGEHPGYLRVELDGATRPVVFVARDVLDALGLAGWRDVVSTLRAVNADEAVPPDDAEADCAGIAPIIIGDSFADDALELFDGAYASSPMGDLFAAIESYQGVDPWIVRSMREWTGAARSKGKIGTVTVFPGYDDTRTSDPGMSIRRDGGRLYQKMWRRAIEADPDWVLIASFNAWLEGTEIEPSVENGRRELITTKRWTAEFKKARVRE